MCIGNSLGFGLGLRPEHYQEIAANPGRVGWFEALSENYMVPGGSPLRWLDRIRRDYPVALHGVSLSIGGIDPLNERYLADLEALIARVDPVWVSDHLCFASVDGLNLHDLLPLPFTEEALAHVAGRVLRVQDRLRRRLVLENVSSYVAFAHQQLPEWEFLAELARRADCDLLLDVNNVHVSAFNHGFDAMTYLRGLPAARIRQFHLAGHSHNGDHIVDTHDRAVAPEVWDLYAEAVRLFPDAPTMIERDADIPPYADLLAELETARDICGATLAAAA
jgi:uncharacterized protein